jgi:DNA replication and repair protein RecF
VRVLALEAIDFRNLSNVLIEPHPRFNVISGDNGQGKTNVLEAIYVLGTLRSFRASKTEELVRFGAARARVRARVDKLGVERLLEVELAPGQKLARVDGKAARAAQYFGGFNVVLFAPEDLRLPQGAPAARRKFMDRAVWNAQPAHLADVQTYERVLRSRNAVLRDGGGPQLLEVYDEQLARAAGPLVARRCDLVDELRPLVEQAFARVTGGLTCAIAYETQFAAGRAPSADVAGVSRETLPSVTDELLARLRAERGRDLARGATSSGPHTDDLTLAVDGHDAAAFASQGQLRALVLALKIAEIELLTQKLGDPPVLLLDDVSSELDATRNRKLFDFLQNVSGQAFITTTHSAHVLLTEERLDFRVFSGAVSQ